MKLTDKRIDRRSILKAGLWATAGLVTAGGRTVNAAHHEEKRKPVGEFGSQAWCEACGKAGAKMLEDANLSADTAWGFSETYLYPPARLLTGDRKISAFHFMVKDGKCSGGDGVTEECLALPGFQISAVWGAICNQSRSLYGPEGQKQRGVDEGVMYKEIGEYVGGSEMWAKGKGGSAQPMIWPPNIVAAVTAGDGLHNVAASMQMPSPEYDGLPTTELGVPIFSKMTEEQKKSFLKLLHIDM